MLKPSNHHTNKTEKLFLLSKKKECSNYFNSSDLLSLLLRMPIITIIMISNQKKANTDGACILFKWLILTYSRIPLYWMSWCSWHHAHMQIAAIMSFLLYASSTNELIMPLFMSDTQQTGTATLKFLKKMSFVQDKKHHLYRKVESTQCLTWAPLESKCHVFRHQRL